MDPTAEDGRLQAVFDLMGITYTGTGYLSSAMAMDKGVTKAMFQMRGVPTPGGKAMKKKDLRGDTAGAWHGFPCCSQDMLWPGPALVFIS